MQLLGPVSGATGMPRLQATDNQLLDFSQVFSNYRAIEQIQIMGRGLSERKGRRRREGERSEGLLIASSCDRVVPGIAIRVRLRRLCLTSDLTIASRPAPLLEA